MPLLYGFCPYMQENKKPALSMTVKAQAMRMNEGWIWLIHSYRIIGICILFQIVGHKYGPWRFTASPCFPACGFTQDAAQIFIAEIRVL